MDEVVVPGGLRARIEEIAGRRIDTGLVIAVVAVLVGAGLLVSSRKPAAAIAPPATAPEAGTSIAPSPAASPQLLVHVAGAVARPGLYALPAGARVADAVEAAGGAARRADLGLLNLAEPLVDGVKIEVLERGARPAAPTPPGAATGAPAAVSLNSADAAALETIPGVGPVTAAAILAYRDEAGPFTSVEQLLEVSGIGPATLESVRPYVTL
ncbi:MAG TPA: ComEA family DNA-binding protein [Actinomycetota bacterium]|nr:ComEA family DNA-binding protein [Actinomycetota bacterium]